MSAFFKSQKLIGIVLCCFCFAQVAQAEHIFGGYLSMKQTSRAPNLYKLNMVTYVDAEPLTSGSIFSVSVVQAVQDIEKVHIYRKRDNIRMRAYAWPKPILDSLTYDNEACAKARRLRTYTLTYAMEVELPPNEFSDPGGYYLVKERCCRNAVLTNIDDPFNTGMVFYLEFPSLLQNGLSLRFSSPTFRPLNGDYICINKTFRYNFAATDPDRDELRYSLVNPLKGESTFSDASTIGPGPYSTIKWLPGYSANNAITGPIPLQIDAKTGVLTVRANKIGLYLFSVQVEKIRAGKVIGMLRHDFQLPVVDCNSLIPPVPVITRNGKPVTEVDICIGQQVTFETTPNPTWAFQWQKDGENIDDATKNQLTVNSVGVYTVVKSLASSCASDTFAIVRVKPANNIPDFKIKASSPNYCKGDSIRLSVPASDTVTYNWFMNKMLLQSGITLPVNKVGVYRVEAQKKGTTCVSIKDSIEVEQWPQSVVKVGQDKPFCKGVQIVLKATLDSTWRYQWSQAGQLLDSTNRIEVSQEGVYTLRTIDANNCKTITNYDIQYDVSCLQIYIPTIFTPNGDGQNDRWHIYNFEADPKAELWVYNRWGEVIYHAPATVNDWDGVHRLPNGSSQKVATGCYAFILKSPSTNHTYQGTVCVMY
jgi:gliding motility-associated-like protein